MTRQDQTQDLPHVTDSCAIYTFLYQWLIKLTIIMS